MESEWSTCYFYIHLFYHFSERRTSMKRGKLLENFVTYVYSNLLTMSGSNSSVSQNMAIKGLSGVVHEFDVYYDFWHLNLLFRVAIECKDWNRPVDKGKVQKFWCKIDDLNNIAGVMISKSGYQAGAIEFAKRKGILLLTLDDLPSFTDILSKKLEYLLLPDEHTKGDPFWTIMEMQDGKSTGTYLNIGTFTHPEIPLFYSKKVAECCLQKYVDKDSLCVRGLSQVQLKSLIRISKELTHAHFAICFYPIPIDDQLQFIRLDYQTLEKFYCLEDEKLVVYNLENTK